MWGVQGAVLLDESGRYAAALGIRGVPTNVCVDDHGVIRTVGATTPRELDIAVQTLLET